jgi:radical SAM superfamily enzyme
MVIHRITGDGQKQLLLAPLWSGNKKLVLNRIHNQMKEKNTYQGKYYTSNSK